MLVLAHILPTVTDTSDLGKQRAYSQHRLHHRRIARVESLVDDRGSLFCIRTHFDVAGRRPVPGEPMSISTARRGTIFLSLVCFAI